VPNPYSEILAALEAALARVPAVRAGSRPGPGPAKSAVAPADLLPGELRVRPAPGSEGNSRSTSSHGRFVQNFSISIATVSLDPHAAFDLKMAVIREIHRAGPTLGLDDYVTDVKFVDFAESNDNSDLNRGHEGAWSAVIGVSVLFRIPRSQLD
jgi:hypothetical protein